MLSEGGKLRKLGEKDRVRKNKIKRDSKKKQMELHKNNTLKYAEYVSAMSNLQIKALTAENQHVKLKVTSVNKIPHKTVCYPSTSIVQ